MKKSFAFILLTILIISVIAATNTSVPTITYFPPDQTVTFQEQNNELDYANNQLHWKTTSTTSEPTYLRQDIAMLYRDGVFLGFTNQWKSNQQTLTFEHLFSKPSSGIYESISYHYSETHNNDDIRSAALMDYSFLQLDCVNTNCQVESNQLKDSVHYNNKVQHHWDELIAHFSIDKHLFTKMSITHLFRYKDQPLPTLSQQETDKVINQLWEGIYANYIIALMDTNEKQRAHYIPLVLIKNDEIQILYEINGKKEQLIQKINP